MRKFIYIIFMLQLEIASGQIITTVAGNGTSTYLGDGGAATAAGIGFAGTIGFDNHNNYYFSELNNTVRKVSSAGIISTILGNGTSGYSGDGGPATAAQFNFTGGGGVAFDNLNNLYIADQANHRIRKVDASTNIVSTVIGTGVAGFAGDGGFASAALINAPAYLAVDTIGNLYILDAGNYRIRKVALSGVITTIAGNGVIGFSGDGGPATAAEISPGGTIAIGNHNDLYLADGIRVRKIDLLTGIISTIAGNGVWGFGGDGGLATAAQFYSTLGLSIDRNSNIYVSDDNNHRIRVINSSGIINTVTGNGIPGFSGDGGLASVAQISSPRCVTTDWCGNLYIVDNTNRRIRKINFNPICNPTLNERQISSDVTVITFPNPSSGTLHIESFLLNTQYQLFGPTGTVVQSGKLEAGENTLSLMSLPPGLYMLQLTDDEGKRTVHKIMKE